MRKSILSLILGFALATGAAPALACDSGGCNNRPTLPGDGTATGAEWPGKRLPGQDGIRTRGPAPGGSAQLRSQIADLILAGRLAEAAERLDALSGNRKPADGTKLACSDGVGCNHTPSAPSADAVRIACGDGVGCNNRDESRQPLAAAPVKDPLRLACGSDAGCDHASGVPDRVACNSDNCNTSPEPYIVAMRGGAKLGTTGGERQAIARLVRDGRLAEARAQLADILGRKAP